MVDCPTSQDEIEEMATRPYREFVGALAWFALGTRPDIAFATSSLACFGHNPGRVHWEAATRVLLKGTKTWGPNLGGKSPRIAAFMGADWGSNREDRRSVGADIAKSAMVLLAGNPRSSHSMTPSVDQLVKVSDIPTLCHNL